MQFWTPFRLPAVCQTPGTKLTSVSSLTRRQRQFRGEPSGPRGWRLLPPNLYPSRWGSPALVPRTTGLKSRSVPWFGALRQSVYSTELRIRSYFVTDFDMADGYYL